MDKRDRETLKILRRLGSAAAADWLMATCSHDNGRAGEAYRLLQRLSWARAEQVRLAEYYLAPANFQTGTPYEAVLKIMALPRFIAVLRNHVPEDPGRRDLARYYLHPLLTAHPEYSKYAAEVDALLRDLG